jgi:hypothetical protein
MRVMGVSLHMGSRSRRTTLGHIRWGIRHSGKLYGMLNRIQKFVASCAIPTLAGLLLLCCTAEPSQAALRYRLVGSFPAAEPSNVAVDQTNGDVFVAAVSENSVDQFTPEAGNEYHLAGKVTGIETPQGSFELHPTEPAPVAFDSANGYLYVVDPGHKVVDRFLNGKYNCQYSGPGRGCRPNPESELGSGGWPATGEELTGVAVDPSGNVYISDYTGEAIDEFSATGEDVGQIHASGCGFSNPSGIAFSSTGTAYVQTYFGSLFEGDFGPVSELTLNGNDECTSHFTLDTSRSYDVAVDPLSNRVYVDHGPSVSVYGQAHELLTAFSTGGTESEEGIATYSTKQLVFASDRLGNVVRVFEAIRVPGLRDLESTEVESEDVTVRGEINPEEVAGLSYYFEYGAPGQLTHRTASFALPAVNAYLAVEAHLSEYLSPNTEYGYRLVATNGSIVEKSSEERFTTSTAEPKVTGVQALDVTDDSAVFGGEVNPENTSPTTYHFEYEAEGCNESAECKVSLPTFSIGPNASPVSVAQVLPGNVRLRQSTTYRFRLVAKNPVGMTSEAGVFTTFSSPRPPSGNAPIVSTGAAEAVGSGSAVLTGEVFPDGLPTVYEFAFGTSASHETVLLGGELGGEGGGIPVTQTLSNLEPSVTYHYRVIAFNALGEASGPDETFTTAPMANGVTQPITLPTLATPIFSIIKYPPLKAPKKHVKHKKKPRKAKHPSGRHKPHTGHR